MNEVPTIPDATAEPAAYVEALLATLGDRDPLDVLAATPARVAAILAGRSDEQLRRPPAPGEWPVERLVGHLLDVDIAYGFRMRLTLTEEEARYPAYDEKRFSELPKPGMTEVLAAFTTLRAVNVHLLRSIPPELWKRAGHHAEQGHDPFDVQVRKIAGHDLAHLDQLRRTVAAGDPLRRQ